MKYPLLTEVLKTVNNWFDKSKNDFGIDFTVFNDEIHKISIFHVSHDNNIFFLTRFIIMSYSLVCPVLQGVKDACVIDWLHKLFFMEKEKIVLLTFEMIDFDSIDGIVFKSFVNSEMKKKLLRLASFSN